MPLTGFAPAPIWVDSGPGQGRGYDLLGLRLVAQNLSNTLLDGVTTVTPSVRYLSFRCWIAHRYALAGRPNAREPFSEFAAGVEATIAYGNLLNDPSRSGLLGPVKGRRLILSEGAILPLVPLVDQLGVQIYGGPSAQLCLSNSEDSDVPRLTKERGIPLAEALAEGVSVCELGRLFNAGECPDTADQLNSQSSANSLTFRISRRRKSLSSARQLCPEIRLVKNCPVLLPTQRSFLGPRVSRASDRGG